MPWQSETPLSSSGWTTQVIGNIATTFAFATSDGRTIEVSVDDAGVLISNDITSSNPLTSNFMLKSPSGFTYYFDAGPGDAIITVGKDDAVDEIPEWPIFTQTIESPNATMWNVTVDDAGVLTTTQVT